jgi:hypothetical protein
VIEMAVPAELVLWACHGLDSRRLLVVQPAVMLCKPHDRGAALQGSKLAPACSAAGLQSFPTWIIKGEKVEGEQSFDTLEGLLAAK